MAKDDRKIHRGISILKEPKTEGAKRPFASMKTYVPGMEDELAAAFSQSDLKAMVERGDISGNWKSTKK